MAETIKHTGIVENIAPNHLQIRIVQTSACASCKAHALCSSAESKEKVVDVYDANASAYHAGQEVTLYGTLSMGLRAVVLAYCVPLVLLMVTLMLVAHLTGKDIAGVWAALGVLVVFYLILYLCRNKLKKDFSFTLQTTK